MEETVSVVLRLGDQATGRGQREWFPILLPNGARQRAHSDFEPWGAAHLLPVWTADIAPALHDKTRGCYLPSHQAELYREEDAWVDAVVPSNGLVSCKVLNEELDRGPEC